MQTIIAVVCSVVLLFPSIALAAAGASGTVETMGASQITDTIVSVNASTYASGSGSKLSIEYGPTPNLGRMTPGAYVATGALELGQVYIYGLTPSVKYYYRAVLQGTLGTVYGETKTFVAGMTDDAQYVTPANTSGNGQSGSVYPGTDVPQQGVNGGSANTSGTTGNNALGSLGTASVGNAFGNGSTDTTGTTGYVERSPAGFFQTLFDSVTGARPLSVTVTMNPSKPSPRQIVEYTVSMKNASGDPVSPGTLTMTLPKSVVYMGDNTGGKMVLSNAGNTQKLTMATEAFRARETKVLTMMGVATNDVSTLSPVVGAEIAYKNHNGVYQRAGTGGADIAVANNQLTASVATVKPVTTETSSESQGILPSSFFDWLVFVAMITGIIVIVRRFMAVYQEKKKRLLEEEEASKPLAA